MRIITANLNGIRSANTKGFFTWMHAQNADVVCVQETKIQAEQMTAALLAPSDASGAYTGHFHYAQKAGYSGVGVYTQVKPSFVKIGFDSVSEAEMGEFDFEGRMVQVDLPTVTVISAYFPSGSSGDERQAAKFRFLAKFLPHLKTLQAACKVAGRGLLVCGDVNIAHAEIDLKNWQGNLKNSGFTPEERAWMTALLTEHGMVDVWRTLYPQDAGYTWWSNRGAAYEKNVGWRIDYQLASADFAAKARSASVYKGEKFSDHAPLVVDYTL
jgi:exodeoxyribonuclease III